MPVTPIHHLSDRLGRRPPQPPRSPPLPPRATHATRAQQSVVLDGATQAQAEGLVSSLPPPRASDSSGGIARGGMKTTVPCGPALQTAVRAQSRPRPKVSD